MPHRHRTQAGFVLLPVTLLLVVVAAAAWLVNRDGSTGTGAVARASEDVEARYVASAGLAHATWTARNSGCSGYSLAATNFGAHQYSAVFTPDNGSPVDIAATGVLGSGTTRTRSVSDVAVYEAPVTLDLQPDAAEGKDTRLYMWSDDRNYGVSTSLVVSNKFSDSVSHTLIQFDVSAVPANAVVTGATLSLLQDFAGAKGGTVSVHAVSSDWSEGTESNKAGASNWIQRDTGTDWTTAGGDYDAGNAATSTFADRAVGWYQWDVTALVGEWVNGIRANQGLALIPATAGIDMYFDSSDVTTPANRPRLVIEYACECGVPCATPATTAVAAPGASSDDAEERSDTSMYVNSTDLELVEDSSVQTVGIRFPGLGVPVGAEIVSAVVEFTVDETGSDPTSITFRGEAVDDALSFVDSDGDITARALTTASVDWNTIPAWDTVGVMWTSPDITAVVQEIVDRAGWAGGNALAIVITGSGERTAESWDGEPDLAPVLRISYRGGTGPAYAEAYVDLFETATCDPASDYANSDGAMDWTDEAWSETGDDDDPCAGSIRLTDDGDDRSLLLSGADKQVERAVNLAGATHATWRLDYRRQDLDDSGDYVVVEVSGNGSGWTEVGRIEGSGTDVGYRPFSADILAFAAADTGVRLRTVSLEGSGAGEDIVFVDNLRIDTDATGISGPACAATLADDFASGDYTGSSGSEPWSGSWIETGDSGGSSGGDLRIETFDGRDVVRLKDDDNRLHRLASLVGFGSAVLQYDYWRFGLDDEDDYISVQVSSNGGASYTEVRRHVAGGTDSAWQSESLDVSAYLGTGFALRLETSEDLGNNDVVRFSGFQVCLN